jgi:hypothetical protein
LAVFHALRSTGDGFRLRSGRAVRRWEVSGLHAAGRA